MVAGRPPGRSDETPGGFLSRWSQRKTVVRQGGVPLEPVLVEPLPAALPAQPTANMASRAPDNPPLPAEPPAPPPPTLADVAALTPASDYSRFVAPGVDVGVKNAALKKLFTDPHFNIMDGLDTYIDDYGKPDPLPVGMLRQMVQSHALGLFSGEDDDDAPAVAGAQVVASALVVAPTAAVDVAAPDLIPPPDRPPEPTPSPDENPDLRLQPHTAAGPAGIAAGPGPDTGRQH